MGDRRGARGPAPRAGPTTRRRGPIAGLTRGRVRCEDVGMGGSFFLSVGHDRIRLVTHHEVGDVGLTAALGAFGAAA